MMEPYLTRKPNHRSKKKEVAATTWHNFASHNYCPAVVLKTLFYRFYRRSDQSFVEAVRVGKVADHRYLRNTLYSRENLGMPFHSLYP